MGGAPARSGVDLLWIPLGAGSALPIVRWNGNLYEALVARRERRSRLDLYHAALEVWAFGARSVVEMTPAWGSSHSPEGAVASGPVGMRFLGRSKLFRYEVHCWRDGTIPDREYAVGGAQVLTNDGQVARRVLDLAPDFPTAVWGRDDIGTDDMELQLVGRMAAGSRRDPVRGPHPSVPRPCSWMGGGARCCGFDHQRVTRWASRRRFPRASVPRPAAKPVASLVARQSAACVWSGSSAADQPPVLNDALGKATSTSR